MTNPTLTSMCGWYYKFHGKSLLFFNMVYHYYSFQTCTREKQFEKEGSGVKLINSDLDVWIASICNFMFCYYECVLK